MTEERMQTFKDIEADIKSGMSVTEATKKAGKNPNWYHSTRYELRGARKKGKTPAKVTRKKYTKRPKVQMVDLANASTIIPVAASTGRLLVFTGSASELLNIARGLS